MSGELIGCRECGDPRGYDSHHPCVHRVPLNGQPYRYALAPHVIEDDPDEWYAAEVVRMAERAPA